MSKEMSISNLPKKDFLCPSNLTTVSKIINSTSDVCIIGSGYSLIMENSLIDNKTIISTSKISELKKFFHGDHYLEIGAAVHIGELLSSTKNELPRIVQQALLEIGPKGVRNSATIGGTLCLKSLRSDCFLPLCLVESEVEIRSFTSEAKKKSQRWIPLKNLEINKTTLDIAEGEILTKIRIPMQNWDIQFFRKIGKKYQYGKDALTFAAVGKLDKGLISEFKIMLSNGETSIKGKTNIETLFIGYPFPLSYHQIQETQILVHQFCEGLPKGFTPLEKYSIKQLIFQTLTDGSL